MGGGGGGSRQEFGASQQFANIAREQWGDFRNRYLPYLRTMANEVTNPKSVAENVGFAKTAIAKAFDTQRNANAIDLARYGVTPTADQQQQVNTQMALDESSASVAAQNAARQHVADRNLSLMAGGMGAIKNQINQGAH